MKTLIIVGIFLLIIKTGNAQQSLFTEVPIAGTRLNTADQSRLGKFGGRDKVKQRKLVRLNSGSLQQKKFKISVGQQSSIVEINQVKTISSSEFSLFGRLSDETGIFLTVAGNQVASKFYLGYSPYTLLPFNDEYHVLIEYDQSIDAGKCGSVMGKGTQALNKDNQNKTDATQQKILADDDCRMRVLLVVTAQAEPEIPVALELAARMLEDESNLAYQQSQISYRMEIARVIRTNFVETTNSQNSTEYGQTSSFPTDLLDLRSGGGLLTNIPGVRNNYAADVVIMIRSAATNAAMGFYGIVLGVPTGLFTPPSDNNAFALISTEFMIGGRFTFAHEIGHIQGARHENHSATPTYARGYVYTTGGFLNRTIMANGCGIDATTGCRVQFFSNPNISIGGTPIGVAGQFDNARRINETVLDVLNFRATSTNLLLPAETFDAGILGRHIAFTSISTNNTTVTVSTNSRVSFRAGSTVTLLPGFSAASGSEFLAYLSNCSDAPLLKQPVTENTIVQQEESNVSSNEAPSGLSVFPNPSNNNITIRIDQAKLHLDKRSNFAQITIVDLYNREHLVMKADVSAGNLSINTGKLTSGNYFVVVRTKDSQWRTPLVIIK